MILNYCAACHCIMPLLGLFDRYLLVLLQDFGACIAGFEAMLGVLQTDVPLQDLVDS